LEIDGDDVEHGWPTEELPELVTAVGEFGLKKSLGALLAIAGAMKGKSGGAAAPGTVELPEFTAALGVDDAPEFTAASGAADAPEFTAALGSPDEPEFTAALGADMAGCDASGGMGAVSTGSSAEIGELGGEVVALAATGGDIVGLGCGVGDAVPLLA
jgi:hypothetical protein